MRSDRRFWFAAVLLGVLLALSSCTQEFLMKSPLFMGEDRAQDAKEKAEQVAQRVERLHEPMHHGFFGENAEERRTDAAWDLGHELEATSAIPDLAQALGDENPDLRANAAASLWYLAEHVEAARAPLGEPAVQMALRRAFGDPALRVRLHAVRTIAALTVPQKPDPASVAAWRAQSDYLVRVLYEVAQGPNLDDAMWAADLAVTLGGQPRDVVPFLMRGIDLHSAAAILLSNLDDQPANIAYLPVLLVGARSNDDDVRAQSINRLGDGVYRNPAVQALLVDAVFDPADDVRLNAVQSLVVGGETFAPGTVFGAGLGSENPTVALLLGLLHDPSYDIRAQAATDLGQIKSSAPEVVAALAQGAGDLDPDARLAAVDALQRIGPAASAAAPALRAIWEANRPTVVAKDDAGRPDTHYVDQVHDALAEIEAPAPDGGSPPR